MKKCIAIMDRKILEKYPKLTINWQKGEEFTFIKKIPSKKTINKVDSVEIINDTCYSYIFSEKEFKKNFKFIKE